MKKTLYVFTPIFLAFIILFSAVTPVVAMSEDISSKVFRLHILANSDSVEDQTLKLKIKDKVLELSESIYSGCTSVNEAIKASDENIKLIKETVQKVISFYGYTYDCSVFVTREYFNTRKYDSFTLPAGVYNSLKIIIGEGRGHNWWCVMFPTVCLSGCTEDFDEYLTEDEKEMITSNGYIVRFKAAEIIEKIKSKIM